MAYGSYSPVQTKKVWYRNSDYALPTIVEVYAVNITYQYAQDTVANKTKIKASISMQQEVSGWGMSGSTLYTGIGGSTSATRKTTTTTIGGAPPNTINGVQNYEWEVTGGGTQYIYWYAYTNSADTHRPTQSSWTYTSITTPAINRATTSCSASNVTSGNNCSVTWTPLNSTFKFKIKFELGLGSELVSFTTDYISPNTTSSYTYTGGSGTNHAHPMDAAYWGPAIPNTTTGSVKATLYTYTSDSTLLGSCATNFTYTLATSVRPTATAARVIIDGYPTSNPTALLQNRSKIQIDTTASGSCGSTISNNNIVVTVNSQTLRGASVTSGILTTAGSQTATIKVTDSRGRTLQTNATVSFTVTAYSPPTITSFKAQRCTSTGTNNNDGAYFHCTGSTSHTNLSSIGVTTHGTRIRYRPTGSSTWSKFIPTVSSSDTYVTTANYTIPSATVLGINTEASYDIQIEVTDGVTTIYRQVAVPSVFVLMDFGASGNSMAIGKVAEYNNWLDVGLATEFRKQLYIQNANVSIEEASTTPTYMRISTISGGKVDMQYASSGNHGIYSNGYTATPSQANTNADDAFWLIYRAGSNGNVYVPNWQTKGSSSKPVYFNSSGAPTEISSLTLSNTDITIDNITANHRFWIKSPAGGEFSMLYSSTSGAQGLYSNGYGSSISDSSAFTSDAQWIIARTGANNVIVPLWADIGDSKAPVYFDSNGKPVAVAPYTLLYNGTFWSTTATSLGNDTYGPYNEYIVVYNNSATTTYLTFVVPRTLIGNGASGSNYTYGFGADTNWGSVRFYYVGTALYMQGVSRSGTSVNIRRVYGLV